MFSLYIVTNYLHNNPAPEFGKVLDEPQIITLVPINNAKTITLETDSVLIIFELEEFKTSLKVFQQRYNTKDNQALIVYIDKQISINDDLTIKMHDLPQEYEQTLERRVADLLEDKKVKIYDKKLKKYLNKIKIEEFGTVIGGRKFINPQNDSVFWTTFDWIA